MSFVSVLKLDHTSFTGFEVNHYVSRDKKVLSTCLCIFNLQEH